MPWPACCVMGLACSAAGAEGRETRLRAGAACRGDAPHRPAVPARLCPRETPVCQKRPRAVLGKLLWLLAGPPLQAFQGVAKGVAGAGAAEEATGRVSFKMR